MKKLFCILLSLCLFAIVTQANNEFETYLNHGKEIVKAKDDGEERPNYRKAVEYLEKVISIKPNNVEAHYFLGYAYSRLNAFDGKEMNEMDIATTNKISNQFETVIRLSPKYEGEIVILDPYSKLTGEWGAQSLCYWSNSKTDSAKWALEEGKKRGGFGDLNLQFAWLTMSQLPQNSILISHGDLMTFPLWCVQVLENYRPDIILIDATLLNTIWYPKLIERKYNISFGYSDTERDSIGWCEWTTQEMNVLVGDDTVFSWMLPPSYYDYILRGDRLLISLLGQNKFKREVFFTLSFDPDNQLGLQNYVQDYVVAQRVNYDNQEMFPLHFYLKKVSELAEIMAAANPNSQEELFTNDRLRLYLYAAVSLYLDNERYNEAYKLFKAIDDKMSLTKFKPHLDNTGNYYYMLKERLETEKPDNYKEDVSL